MLILKILANSGLKIDYKILNALLIQITAYTFFLKYYATKTENTVENVKIKS